MSHPEAQLSRFAVVQSEQLITHDLPAPALLPHLGRVQDGEEELLAADGVHLFADDLRDLTGDPQAQGQQGVGAGHQLANEARPNQQPVADGFRVGGILPQGGYEGS